MSILPEKRSEWAGIHQQLAKSAGTIGALTAVSRVLGFIRDIVIAGALGTGLGAEAFVVSFKIPNLLRDLVGEGATNSAFVPVMTECHEKKPENFWQLVSTLFLVLSLVLLALTALGIIFAGQIVALLAPGFLQAADPQKYPLTVQLTRVIFPYIFLIGLSALAMGVLNTLKEFKSSAMGPVFLNLCIIASAFFLEPSWGPLALVLGVLVGGVFQLVCQIPPLLKSGFRFTRPGFEHGFARKIGKLLLPRALGSALYQINVFVDSILASFESWVGASGQSALYYSNRIFQLPLAILGVSLAQAILPTFSTQIVRGDREGFKETLSLAIRSLMYLAMPASLGLMVWAKPIVRTLFEHGKFNAYSTEITCNALFYYSFGLLSCCFIKIFVNAFYSMQDTRTPVKTMMFSVALNVMLSLIFMRRLGIGGLALASSISATVNLGLLYFFLKKKIGPLNESKIIEGFFKMLSAGVVMVVLALAYERFGLTQVVSAAHWVQALALAGGIGLCAFVYFMTCRAMGIKEFKGLFHGRS